MGASTGTAGTVRLGGWALVAGSVVWAVTALVTRPERDGPMHTAELVGGLAFQLGLFGLLAAIARTGAVGRGRAARASLTVEWVLLALATLWSVIVVVDTANQERLAVQVLDAAWPLSMLGLLAVAVVVHRAGVWPLPLRRLLLLANLWLLLDIAAYALGNLAALVFHGVWLVAVWGGLGVLLVRSADRLTPPVTDRAGTVSSSVG